MKTITKSDLANNISEKLGISVLACEDIINQTLEAIMNQASENNILHIKNFGSFSVHSKKPRPGMDISKQKAITIAEKTVLRFSATRKLRQLVNS